MFFCKFNPAKIIDFNNTPLSLNNDSINDSNSKNNPSVYNILNNNIDTINSEKIVNKLLKINENNENNNENNENELKDIEQY